MEIHVIVLSVTTIATSFLFTFRFHIINFPYYSGLPASTGYGITRMARITAAQSWARLATSTLGKSSVPCGLHVSCLKRAEAESPKLRLSFCVPF